jgi:hypothetical protein
LVHVFWCLLWVDETSIHSCAVSDLHTVCNGACMPADRIGVAQSCFCLAPD